MRTMRYMIGVVLALGAQALLPAHAWATSVKELTRIEGQGESILRGVGLVIGLSNTGDSSKDLAVARPLVALLQNNGQGIGVPEEITRGKTEFRSVALVSVTCVVPREGARTDDTFDVTVSCLNTANSLKGGELYMTVLQGPLPGAPVFAVAAGKIELEDASVPTSARVRGGARMIKDILMPEVGESFNLIVDTPYVGWSSVSTVAEAIQSNVALSGRASLATPRVARVLDDRTIKITIPIEERGDKAAFLADVLNAQIKTELLDLPAQVIINQRTGAIIVTGDVTISPVAITHKDLQITTTTPTPTPTPQNPQVRRERWTDVATNPSQREFARLSDLLAALRNLDIPVQEQINIVQMLHKTGKMQAKLVMD
jgi:flagellar P-ring protein FlgI